MAPFDSMERLPQQSFPYLLLCIWITCIGASIVWIAAYSNTPTRSSEQGLVWPRNAGVKRMSDRPTLITLLHPKCACSRATVTELSRLLAQSPNPVDVKFLLYEPGVDPASWEQSDLVSAARLIPGGTVIVDHRGNIASLFGMSVSGQTALYARDGKLLFSGGITAARGHAGENAGRSAIRDILLGTPAATTHTPVFGCSIRNES